MWQKGGRPSEAGGCERLAFVCCKCTSCKSSQAGVANLVCGKGAFRATIVQWLATMCVFHCLLGVSVV